MADLELHLLDVGAIEYGDSVLCRIAGKTVLIDGGKKKSATETMGRVAKHDVTHAPIQDQVEAIIGGTHVDLLVITHCHSDHVGDLPRLIIEGELSCTHALLADPQFGFGITGDAAEPGPAADMTPAEKLWMALREEPVHSKDDNVIREFIEDSANEYAEYVGLVNHLKQKLGTNCVLYRGPEPGKSQNLPALLTKFAPTGLRILGPSFNQLGNCAAFLVGRDADLVDMQGFIDQTGRLDIVAAYREAVRLQTTGDEEDAGENGNAVNNQSMVITIGTGPQRALLTADMQFAKPQLANAVVKQEMIKLEAAIAADVQQNGPYGFVKLSHHGATNGQDQARMTKWGAKLLAISTGSASTKHPTEPTLAALKAMRAADTNIRFGRVDLNGRITYTANNTGRSLKKQRGKWNDLTEAAARSGDAIEMETDPETRGEHPTTATGAGEARVTVERTTTALAGDDGNVEVVIRLPNSRTRVSVTVEIDPAAGDGGGTRPL
jgi:beta-lactamase superfamily II metal-dependent hydrolase